MLLEPPPPRTGKKKRKSPHIPQLKVLTPLQRQLRLGLALRAFQPQHHLLRRFGLLVEDGFGLAAVAGLFAVVAAFALGEEGGLDVKDVSVVIVGREEGRGGEWRGEEERGTDLAGFVLGDFVLGVFLAVFALAVGAAGLGNVDLLTRDVLACAFSRFADASLRSTIWLVF